MYKRLISLGPEEYAVYPNGDEVYNVEFAYACRNWTGTLKCQTGEVEQLRFFPLEELPPTLSDQTRRWLADWARFRGRAL